MPVPVPPARHQPLTIFLSSTAQDLGEYRRAVGEAIERLGHAQSQMEMFGARTAKSLAECRQLAATADALVVIVGHRYGWIPQPQDGGDGSKSITWHEVEAATAAAVPVFRYLCGPSATFTENSDGNEDNERLEDFRKFLRQFPCDTFSAPADLAMKAAIALGEWSRNRARDYAAALRMICLPQSGEQTSAFQAAGLDRLPLLTKAIYSPTLLPGELAPLVEGAQVRAATTMLDQRMKQYAKQESALNQELAAADTKAQNIRKEVSSIETERRPTEPVFIHFAGSDTGFKSDFQKQAEAQAYTDAINRHYKAQEKHKAALAEYEQRQQTLPEKQQLLVGADLHVSQIRSNLTQLTNAWTEVRQQLEKDVRLARARDIVALLQAMCTKSNQLLANTGTLTQGFLSLLATGFACSYLMEALEEDLPSTIRLSQVQQDVAEVAEATVRQNHQLIGQDCLTLLLPLTEKLAVENGLLSQMRAGIAALPRREITSFGSEAGARLALKIPNPEVDLSLIDPVPIALAYQNTAREKDELTGSIGQNDAFCQKNTALYHQVQAARQVVNLRLEQLKAHAALGQASLSNGKLAWDILAKAAQTQDLGTDTRALCAALLGEAERRFEEPIQLIARYETKDFGIPEAQRIITEKFPDAFLMQMQALSERIEKLKTKVPEFERALVILLDLPRQQVQRFKNWVGPLMLLAILPGINLLYLAYISLLVHQFKPAFVGSHAAYLGLREWALPRLAWATGTSAVGAIGSALAWPVIKSQVYWADPTIITALLIGSYGVSMAIILALLATVLRAKKSD